ncbi:pyridoxamine 5'-phosphate oxidase family protein [Yoonia sp.]|uniref:pyridoxamine 5'-phosphate oxidase family protein n=1 Tax=Yoonia sp. TaxID=2212373 RepID=UPI001A06DEE8|nr:pyridoxamine 5'-phosphate oxidase family protein [Yoonia sp.]MBE0412248.1 pyridoxamine 5'-phosphate oxidase family protein [Yoonia sp.]
MTDGFATLDGLYRRLWHTLETGVRDAAHPARRPTFATVSPTGWPEARTVVLRSADRGGTALTIHTDLCSGKIASLRATPRAALHVWDAEQALQIRVQADVTMQSGPDILPLWNSIPDHAQQSYGVIPPPGQPIATALDYIKRPDPATFAVLHCQIAYIDVVHLGAVHRRASFSRDRHWEGQWLSP